MNNLKIITTILKSPALGAIFRWSKPVRASVLFISFLGVVSSVLGLVSTLVIKNLVDGATSGSVALLWRYGILFVTIIILQRLLAILTAHLRLRSSVRFQLTMQQMVTKELMGKEYAALKVFHSGQLVNRVFSDVAVVQGGIMSLLPSLLSLVVSFGGAAIILITMDWRFVPVMILAGAFGSIVTIAFRNPMKNRHKRMQEAEDNLHASTQETLENVRLIKASVGEEDALDQLDFYREQLLTQQIRNGKLSIIMNNGMGSMFDLSRMICYIWGCVKIFQGSFTYGSLTALISLVGRIQSPIANAVGLVGQIYGVVSSAERLMEVVDLPDEEVGTELTSFNEIRLNDMSFQYDDGDDDVLINLNTEIKRGDFVALTGISGGGKTSLFQLLLAIYKPTSGSILFIDGNNEVPACRGTRSLFAYVPQGNTLFSGSLRDNIIRFKKDASEEELYEAIHAACLDNVVKENGLDTKLGEHGIGLSEGQAQRVAVARALLSNAPILLLDEATSALDEETEAKMLENIGKMKGEKTVIIVTHRKAALKICDYQLHIEEGRMTRKESTGQ